MFINPQNKNHARLEDTASEYLRQRGYYVKAQTYHETFENRIADMLKTNSKLSALYIRSRADRMAIGKDNQFEFEVKTHVNKNYGDLTLEILPLMIHSEKSIFIDCLYVCNVNDIEFGFWASNIPPIKMALLPDVEKNKHVIKIIKTWSKLQNVSVYSKQTSGSNDPCIIIAKNEIAKLNNWRNLIP